MEFTKNSFSVLGQLAHFSQHDSAIRAWTGDELLQEMWGGMLASSCDTAVATDKNLVLLNTLEKMTPVQVKLLNNAVDRFSAAKSKDNRAQITYSGEQLIKVKEIEKLDDFNSQYYNMIELGVLENWIITAGEKLPLSWLLENNKTIAISPSWIGMEIVLRGRGLRSSPEEYITELSSLDIEETISDVGLT